MLWPAALDRARRNRLIFRPWDGAHTYHPVLKHSRFAAKLRAGRYMWAPSQGLRCRSSFRPGAVGPGRASSLIIALLEELLLLRLFLWFWVYLFLLNCYCGWAGYLAFRCCL